MDPSQRPIADDELVAQMGWVLGLARSLVRDPHVADDVAQGAFFTALERPPHSAHSGASLRAWLATVTRTLARQSVRSETRRHAREHKAARAEAGVSTFHSVARAEIQQHVVDAVLALEEPYRSTVLLRYLRGLSAPEIAERMDCTSEAVRKRLSRGLDRLRGDLDGRYGGDSRAWVAALMPLLGLRTKSAASMGGAGGIAAVAGSLTVLGVAAWMLFRPVPAFESQGPPRALSAVLPVVEVDLPEASDARPRAFRPHTPLPRLPALSSPSAPPVAAAPDLPVHGRVFDAEGRPLPNVELLFEVRDAGFALPFARGPGAALIGEADEFGDFDLGLAKGSGRVASAGQGWTTVEAGFPSRARAGEPVSLVLAPSDTASGGVRDASGAPLANARVRFLLPDDYESRFDELRQGSGVQNFEARSDADGRFELPEVPLLRGGALEVSAPGWRTEIVPLPAAPLPDFEVRLQSNLLSVAGRVQDEAGRAVADVEVSNGVRATSTDASGRFTLSWVSGELARLLGEDDAPLAKALLAAKAGYQPTQLTLPIDASTGLPEWPDPLVLTLGPPPLALSGYVRDPDGRPLSEALVWIDGGTVLRRGADFSDPSITVTTDGKPPEASSAPQTMRLVESLLAGDPENLMPRVRTDADGFFVLDGLLDREYVVLAAQDRRGPRSASAPTHPGAGLLELVVDTRATYPALSGVVVDRAGEPVAGVRLSVGTRGVQLRYSNGNGSNTLHDPGSSAVSDAEGHFTLADVPREFTRVRLAGETIVPREFGAVMRRDALREVVGARPEELTWVVQRRAQVQLRRDARSAADALMALDGRGEPLPLHRFKVGRHEMLPTLPVHAGRSAIFVLPDDAAWLVLLRGEQELERLPLTLRVDALNVLR